MLGNYDQYTVEFAGYENCKFSIYYNVNTDSITQIRVDFPYTNYLDNHYANSSIIKQLNEKYGKSKEDRMNWGVRTEGQVSNDWTYNGIRISTVFLWNSESDKVGDNKFHLHYYTKAKSSKAIKPSDDL